MLFVQRDIPKTELAICNDHQHHGTASEFDSSSQATILVEYCTCSIANTCSLSDARVFVDGERGLLHFRCAEDVCWENDHYCHEGVLVTIGCRFAYYYCQPDDLKLYARLYDAFFGGEVATCQDERVLIARLPDEVVFCPRHEDGKFLRMFMAASGDTFDKIRQTTDMSELTRLYHELV